MAETKQTQKSQSQTISPQKEVEENKVLHTPGGEMPETNEVGSYGRREGFTQQSGGQHLGSGQGLGGTMTQGTTPEKKAS